MTFVVPIKGFEDFIFIFVENFVVVMFIRKNNENLQQQRNIKGFVVIVDDILRGLNEEEEIVSGGIDVASGGISILNSLSATYIYVLFTFIHLILIHFKLY